MDFVEIGQQFGVPVLILCALAWAVWKICNRCLDEVIKPLGIRHMAHIDAVDKKDEQLVQTLASIAVTQTEAARTLIAIGELLHDNDKTLDAIHRSITQPEFSTRLYSPP